MFHLHSQPKKWQTASIGRAIERTQNANVEDTRSNAELMHSVKTPFQGAVTTFACKSYASLASNSVTSGLTIVRFQDYYPISETRLDRTAGVCRILIVLVESAYAKSDFGILPSVHGFQVYIS